MTIIILALLITVISIVIGLITRETMQHPNMDCVVDMGDGVSGIEC